MDTVQTTGKTEAENKTTKTPAAVSPFETLRSEIDRLFDNFQRSNWLSPFRTNFSAEPFWRHDLSWGQVPAVNFVEGEKEYEIAVELPGMDEKNVEVKVTDDLLTIKGEKSEEKEEKKKDYYVSERQFGSFQRTFRLPESVEADKIDATFKKGVLKVRLPKSAEAKKKERKIAVSAS